MEAGSWVMAISSWEGVESGGTTKTNAKNGGEKTV